MFDCRIRIGAAALAAAIALIPAPAARASGDTALGAYLSSECAGCHQASGRQQGAIPAITGLPAEQFVALMRAYRDKQRYNATMQTIAGRLTQGEIEALAAHYESLKPAR